MINLNDLRYFVAAVDRGGFAAAARGMNVPRSTVSKRVNELERVLAVTLLERSSRRFRLTTLGKEFYQHAAACLVQADIAQEAVTRHVAEPQGTVRITSTVTRAGMLAPLLPELADQYPRIQVVLHATDSVVDIRDQGFDIAIRSHLSQLQPSELIVRKLESQPIVLVGSPQYLARKGSPNLPSDLNAHHAAVADVHNPDGGWLVHSDMGSERVFPSPRLVSNDTAVLKHAALAGIAITCLPIGYCREALESGDLVRILPDHHAGLLTTSLLMPPRRADLPAVRGVVDFLVARLRTNP